MFRIVVLHLSEVPLPGTAAVPIPPALLTRFHLYIYNIYLVGTGGTWQVLADSTEVPKLFARPHNFRLGLIAIKFYFLVRGVKHGGSADFTKPDQLDVVLCLLRL